MKNIASSLVKAQKEFAPALKTSINPHFKSKYASLDACIEAVIDALNNNGIFLQQKTHQDDSGVTVETVFLHESGESLSCGVLHVPASKQDAQGYGSALTYVRRYSLMAACGIAPEDDDGSAASRPAPPKVTALAESAVADYMAMISDSESMDALKKAFGAAYKAAEHVSDAKAQARFEQAKDKRKTQLMQEIAAQG